MGELRKRGLIFLIISLLALACSVSAVLGNLTSEGKVPTNIFITCCLPTALLLLITAHILYSQVSREKLYWIQMDAVWLRKCPACKKSKLVPSLREEFLGLIEKRIVECEKCGAIFVKSGEVYKFFKISDSSNAVWREYGNETLTTKEWVNIAKGGMSDKKQKEADMEYWLNQLAEGKISIEPIENPSIRLKKGEKVILELASIRLIEPRSKRTKWGYHEESTTIDTGTLTLSNQRIVFSGVNRTININFKKIISIQTYSNGVSISRVGKQRRESFIDMEKFSITQVIRGRPYELQLSGLIFKSILDGLAKKTKK